jgi:tetratricopeptide (TPR) repeat protein
LKSIRPLRADEQLLYGDALAGVGKLPEALEEANVLIDKEPARPGAWFLRGNVLQLMGSHKEACLDFQKAIELDPKFTIAYFYLTQSKKIGKDDRPIVAVMENLAASMPKRGVEYGALNLALGNAYNGLKDYESALKAFDEANRTFLAQDKNQFNPENLEGYIDNLIRLFNRDFFARIQEFSNPSSLPLFVVGMPRSGTTLTESILASHPDVAAGGEIAFWGKAGPAIVKDREGKIDRDLAKSGGQEYLRLLRRLGPNAKRVTDKLPANHLHVGILHAIFPEARFLHCRRNPVDTCLSFYMSAFSKPPSYAHSRENLVFYYRQYARLMRHWKEVIPPDRLTDVVYEDLVVHQEELSRRMIAYCGLEWNDACLAPEKSERAVSTASHYQVRQPVYTSSVERWRNYEPWLGVFKELIDEPPIF